MTLVERKPFETGLWQDSAGHVLVAEPVVTRTAPGRWEAQARTVHCDCFEEGSFILHPIGSVSTMYDNDDLAGFSEGRVFGLKRIDPPINGVTTALTRFPAATLLALPMVHDPNVTIEDFLTQVRTTWFATGKRGRDPWRLHPADTEWRYPIYQTLVASGVLPADEFDDTDPPYPADVDIADGLIRACLNKHLAITMPER